MSRPPLCCGPEAHFSDKPKAPTWTVRARYKSTASVMPGMGGMFGEAEADKPRPQAGSRARRRASASANLLGGAIPH